MWAFFIMVQKIGKVTGAFGGVYFAETPGVRSTEIAFASIVRTSEGRLFVHEIDNLLVDALDLLHVHLWFEYLSVFRKRPDGELLVSDEIAEEIRREKQFISESLMLPLLTVTYPDKEKRFFETFDPTWSPMPCSEQNIQEYALEYRSSRTKTSTTDAHLQFSKMTQLQKININICIQIAIGMALQIALPSMEKNAYMASAGAVNVDIKRQKKSTGFWNKKPPETTRKNVYLLAK